ncbi:Lrp/AsnC family transcriptional regulator [Streptomyces sp. CO7]
MKKREQRPLLDELDRRIVGLLAEDPELTNKALARRLGLAESTCAYRVRALRERGVVEGTTLRLDFAALGHPLQALIKVRLERHNAEHVNRLYASLVKTPGVIQVFHVAGADDFYLHVAVADAEALRDFVLLHVTVHRVVRQTETHLIFERREGVGVLPVPDPAAD